MSWENKDWHFASSYQKQWFQRLRGVVWTSVTHFCQRCFKTHLPREALQVLKQWATIYAVNHWFYYCGKQQANGQINWEGELSLPIYSSNECLQESVTEASHLPNHFIITARSLHCFSTKRYRNETPSQMSVLSFSPMAAWIWAEGEFMKNEGGENIKFK